LPTRGVCSYAILNFLTGTNVGRRIPGSAEEDAQSKASEWKLWEREKAEEKSYVGSEAAGSRGFLQERNEVRKERVYTCIDI